MVVRDDTNHGKSAVCHLILFALQTFQANLYGSSLLICHSAWPYSGLVRTLFESSASPVRQLTHWRRTGPKRIPSKNSTNPGKYPVKSWLFNAGNKTGIFILDSLTDFFVLLLRILNNFSIEPLLRVQLTQILCKKDAVPYFYAS